MIFDTHCHYNDTSFDIDRGEIFRKLPDEGVDRICEIGYNLESSEAAVRLAKAYGASPLAVHAAVGFHPENADELSPEGLERLEELTYAEEVLALGEIGLDYYRLDKRTAVEKERDEERKKRGEEVLDCFNPEPKVQKECFITMLELAKKRDLPVVIHSRDAALDTFRIIRDHKGYVNGGRDSFGTYCNGDGLSVYGTSSRKRNKELLRKPPVCSEAFSGAKGDFYRRSNPEDGRERKKSI